MVTKLQYVIFYTVVIGFLSLIAPAFGNDLTVPDQPQPEAPIFTGIIVLDLGIFVWNLVSSTFTPLLGLVSTNAFAGIIFSALTFGLFWTILEFIRGN